MIISYPLQSNINATHNTFFLSWDTRTANLVSLHFFENFVTHALFRQSFYILQHRCLFYPFLERSCFVADSNALTLIRINITVRPIATNNLF